MEEIINKVANSGLVTIDLEELFPVGERVAFDIKPILIEELLLREKDFREFVKSHDWSQYKNKSIAVFCSSDAIIPRWAWMLLASAFEPFAKKIVFGNLETLEEALFHDLISSLDIETYRDQKVVIKGCSHKPVPVSAYLELTAKLRPIVKSIMYGEPCSTVPVYKRKEG